MVSRIIFSMREFLEGQGIPYSGLCPQGQSNTVVESAVVPALSSFTEVGSHEDWRRG